MKMDFSYIQFTSYSLLVTDRNWLHFLNSQETLHDKVRCTR